MDIFTSQEELNKREFTKFKEEFLKKKYLEKLLLSLDYLEEDCQFSQDQNRCYFITAIKNEIIIQIVKLIALLIITLLLFILVIKIFNHPFIVSSINLLGTCMFLAYLSLVR